MSATEQLPKHVETTTGPNSTIGGPELTVEEASKAELVLALQEEPYRTSAPWPMFKENRNVSPIARVRIEVIS